MTSYSLLLFLASLSLGSSAVLKLNDDNYNKKTTGKTVFLKMFAPWCGHCQSMAPDWEKLAEEWNGHEVGLVAEVDCTDEESDEICTKFGVDAFPTLLYGDPQSPESYEGGRDFESLSEFAKANIAKPVCSVAKPDHCSDEEKKMIEELKKKSQGDLVDLKKKIDKDIMKFEDELEEYVETMNAEYAKQEAEFTKKKNVVKDKHNYKFLTQVLTQVHGIQARAPDTDDDVFDDEDEGAGGDEL